MVRLFGSRFKASVLRPDKGRKVTKRNNGYAWLYKLYNRNPFQSLISSLSAAFPSQMRPAVKSTRMGENEKSKMVGKMAKSKRHGPADLK